MPRILPVASLLSVASSQDPQPEPKPEKKGTNPSGVVIRPLFEIDAKAKKPLTYQEAYDSVPFSRAEYTANPAYRHEAALELVFGVQRATTIVKMPAGCPEPAASPVNQNFFLGLYPSYWALRLGKTY
jgi:hypothetical protein